LSINKDHKSKSRNEFLRTFGLGAIGSGPFGFSLKQNNAQINKPEDNKPVVVINELAIKRNNNKG